MERVFITGRGLVTPLGTSLEVNEAALRSGKSGIIRMPEFAEVHLDSQVGGLPDQNPETDLIERKPRRFCPSVGLMSIIAADEAFREAKFTREEIRESSIALVGGQAGANQRESYESIRTFIEAGYRLRGVSPFAVPRIMPSSAISILSLIFGIRGESYDISAACASSALSIMQAVRLLRMGEYDIALAGGAEQLDWQTGLGFFACHALSTHFNDTPERASRPFDKNRDGFVLAGGAAYVVLENESSIRRRGSRPICEITGVAANSNAVDMVVPDAAASAAVMAKAIADAGLKPSDISYINTHGTATPIGDKVEMDAIRQLMGNDAGKVAINSTKSQTGHMVGATGAAEVIFSTMMMEKGFLSRSLNLDEPDEEFLWADFVREYREGVDIRHALSNSFAFGGSNASLVLSKI